MSLLHAYLAADEAIDAELARRGAEKFKRYFPDCVPGVCVEGSLKKEEHAGLCRALYWRHVAWMQAGADHNERLFMAANQCGKTETAAFEVAAHLTGDYPEWWRGREFDQPTEWWLAGDTMLSTRNVLQVAMLGPVDNVESREWSGMLPRHTVVDITRKSGGVALCVDKVWVKHVSGGESTFEFLSYDQGRKVFQGTGRDGIWLDEEPPDPPKTADGETNDIYSECLLRTITRNGLVLATFTPLRGLTPFVSRYLDTAVMPDTEGNLAPAKQVFWPEEAA